MISLIKNISPYFIVICLLLFIGTIGFSFTEKIPLSDSLYFTVVTVTTVGYGDIYPKTAYGKLLAIILIITGVGTFTAALANGTNFILNRREQAERIQKLNIIINLFFSEIGNTLLKKIVTLDNNYKKVSPAMIVKSSWKKNDLINSIGIVKKFLPDISILPEEVNSVRDFLSIKGNILLRFLENPLIFEHGQFTPLLQAIIHLKDELDHRPSLSGLPEADKKHLCGDFTRVYSQLLVQYLKYLEFLKNNYPYLFSLAVRTNPFDEKGSVIIKD